MNTLVSIDSRRVDQDGDSMVPVFFDTKVAEPQAENPIASFGDQKHRRSELYARTVVALIFCGLYMFTR